MSVSPAPARRGPAAWRAGLAGLLLGAGCATAGGSQPALPTDGIVVLRRMHDAYAGRWYRTLTFVQRTTQRAPDGTDHVSTWYEAISGDRLRIDIGEPAEGNGVLYTADSLYVVRGGKVTRSLGQGNVFIPFIQGVYLQPVERTVAQIEPYHFDLSRVRLDRWEGRPTWVVGARDSADLSTPQFWIDRERLIVTRILVPLRPPQPGGPPAEPQDIRLEGLVPLGGGWLATRVRMLDHGQPLQTEEYSDWRAGIALAPELFVAQSWSSVPHWHSATP